MLLSILNDSITLYSTHPVGIWPARGRGAASSWTCCKSCRRWRGLCRGPAGRPGRRTGCRSAQGHQSSLPSLRSLRPPDPRYCKLTWGVKWKLIVAEHFILLWLLTRMDHWPLNALTVHFQQFSEEKELTFALANYDGTRVRRVWPRMSQTFKTFYNLVVMAVSYVFNHRTWLI